MKASLKYQPDDSSLQAVTQKYAVAITGAVAEIIAQNPQGPVARQYLPSAEELVTTPDELADPIGDEAHSPVKGIVHRYPDRVLLKAVHVCAVYCRFCFRREKIGPGSEILSAEELAAALDYIRRTPSIWEVILTGGDPFILSPRRVREIVAAIEDIAHVKVLRFHTRVPVADPDRVTDEFIEALSSKKAVYVALHCNHADEITPKVVSVAARLSAAGIPLLSQTVLLRGVNDSAQALENLFRRLVEIRVKPYYLHHPDKAPGTAHFRMSVSEGRALVQKLWGRISGVAQPRYVLDIPGGHGKVPLDESTVVEGEKGCAVTDYKGKVHQY